MSNGCKIIQILNAEISIKLVDRMNFLELPILAKYTLSRNAVSPYVMAGPTLGFLLSANRTNDWSDGDHDED